MISTSFLCEKHVKVASFPALSWKNVDHGQAAGAPVLHSLLSHDDGAGNAAAEKQRVKVAWSAPVCVPAFATTAARRNPEKKTNADAETWRIHMWRNPMLHVYSQKFIL